MKLIFRSKLRELLAVLVVLGIFLVISMSWNDLDNLLFRPDGDKRIRLMVLQSFVFIPLGIWIFIALLSQAWDKLWVKFGRMEIGEKLRGIKKR